MDNREAFESLVRAKSEIMTVYNHLADGDSEDLYHALNLNEALVQIFRTMEYLDFDRAQEHLED